MPPIVTSIILEAARLLIDPQVRTEATDLKAAVALLVRRLEPTLPPKDDGTPYTEDDLHAITNRILSLADELRDKMAADSQAPSGPAEPA